MKKMLPILVVGIFVLGGLGAGAFPFKEIETNIISFSDELDQSQENTSLVTEGVVMPVGRLKFQEVDSNFQIAQSFLPTREVLTKVELYIGRNTTASYPYVVAIRDNLTEENLIETSVDPGEIVPLNFSWVEFDFVDIVVEIGQIYYIVSYTENTTDNFYAWGAHNDSESYLYGCAWMSIDDGDTWSNESMSSHMNNEQTGGDQVVRKSSYSDITCDMCFKTFGRDNIPPVAPEIRGETNGKAGKEYEYVITGSDSDGDELYVIIEWGDNTSSSLLGPFSGSYEISMKHTWTEQDVYIIKAKAKDPFGWGPEGKLEVTMPKNKVFIFNFPLLNWLLDRFPNAFPMLRYILGL